MDGLFLLLIAFILFLVIGSIRAFVAGSQISALKNRIADLKRQVFALRRRLDQVEDAAKRAPTAPEPEPESEPEPAGAPGPPPFSRERPPLPTPRFGPPVEERLPAAAAERPAVPKRAPKSAPWPDSDWWARVEEVVGKRWMTYGGGLALFVSVGFFVKYAIEIGWIGPALRVGAGVAFGAAILVVGDWLVRRGLRTFGLGLIGAAGLPVLYVSLFAAFQLYDLVPQWASFAAMVVVTVVGMSLALRHDSLVVSFLSLVGGLLTPMLVTTGQDSRDTLFSYLLMLDVGVLGIAFRRRWRSLDVLAFVGTALYFIGWFTTFYLSDDDPSVVPALLWLGAFYATFLILPFAWHLATRTEATLERFVMGLVVAAAVFGAAYEILNPAHRAALGTVALVMAACYATLGVLVRIRLTGDRKAAFAFLAFAMTFLTVAGPLWFRLNGITIAWSAEAVLLLLLGYRYRYLPVRLGGLVVLGLAIGRLFARHWPLNEGAFTPIANRPFAVAAFVCAAVAAFAIQHSVFRAKGGVTDRVVRRITGLAAGVLSLLVVHFELGLWFAHRPVVFSTYAFHVTGGVVWTVGALLFVAFGIRWRSLTARLASIVVLVIGAGPLLASYADGLPEGADHFLNARFPVAFGVALAGIAIGVILSRRKPLFEPIERGLGRLLAPLSSLVLMSVIGADLGGWLTQYGRPGALAGRSLLWATGALAFLLIGLRARQIVWRMGGLLNLIVAVVYTIILEVENTDPGRTCFLAIPYGTAMAVAAVGFLWGTLLGRHAVRESRWGEFVRCAATVLLLIWTNVELFPCLRSGPGGLYAARCGVTALNALAAGGFLRFGLRVPAYLWRFIAIVVLAVTWLTANRLFDRGMEREFLIFLNLRFGALLLAVAATFAIGRMVLEAGEKTSEGEKTFGRVLLWLTALLGLVVTSAEAWLYSKQQAADAAQARLASQMALSVTWSVYAVILLWIGFRFRLRAIRIAALGLFGVTVGKLVLVDLAAIEQEQIFRILSFFVAGVLMIGGSYLYHRVERHLERKWEE